jgi:hypothetical protein
MHALTDNACIMVGYVYSGTTEEETHLDTPYTLRACTPGSVRIPASYERAKNE